MADWLTTPRRWGRDRPGQLVVLVLFLPLVVPVRSNSSMISHGDWKNSFFKDEIGWPELASQTAQAWSAMSPRERRDGVVLAQNYGEAGALALYGPSRGLPPPLSGHLSRQYRRPPALPQRWALTVGSQQPDLRRLCNQFQIAARIRNHYQLANEELGLPITVCHLRAPLENPLEHPHRQKHALTRQ
jgi:hypothetical protein